MKKMFALLLALAMTFAMTACGGNDAGAEDAPNQDTSTNVETPEDPSEQTDTSAEEDPSVGLTILYEQDDAMINNYSLLAVNPDAPFVDADGKAVSDVTLNTAGADAFINWMLSEGADLAADFGVEDYGENLFYLKDERPTSEVEIPAATEDTKLIRLSTTTSVNDSGLLGGLVPVFEEAYGYDVEIQSAGTGKAIAAAKMGNADLLLVHSKSQEEAFIADGFARIVAGQDTERLTYMYNYFVLVGPSEDPAGVAACASVADAFKAIADGKFQFISRGDLSGTHTKEVSLWPEELGITSEADSIANYTDWYVSSNAGMYVCLTMANEQDAYVLTDKATFLTFRANDGLPVA